MSLQALMALLGHVTTEMTLRYASLAVPHHPGRLRRSHEQGPQPAGPHPHPGRQAHRPGPDRNGCARRCSRPASRTATAHATLAAEACPYANICETCDNFVTTTEFIPALQAQLADITALRDDAAERGWDTEVARHARVIASINNHLNRLAHHTADQRHQVTPRAEGRLIERVVSTGGSN